ALLRPDHPGDGALDSAEGTGEVRIDDGFELLIVHAHEQMVGGDAGSGHDDLEGPQLLLELGEGPADGSGVGDIGGDGQSALGGLTVAGGDGHPLTLSEKLLGDGAADAAVAAGDEDGASF